MDIERKYPFNQVAVLWYQAWRNAIRQAKESTTPESVFVHSYRAAICQAQYITAVISNTD